jgi:Protein kinase domain
VNPADRLRTALDDRYRIERELGQGGMATVYLAHDPRHERKVAIKVLRPELAAVIGAERFVREIRTIVAPQHPHILGLIDSGQVEGTAYYVIPFVEGDSLRDRLMREKQSPPSPGRRSSASRPNSESAASSRSPAARRSRASDEDHHRAPAVRGTTAGSRKLTCCIPREITANEGAHMSGPRRPRWSSCCW